MSKPAPRPRANRRRKFCIEIAAELHAKLPRPDNFASYMGWGLRKLRLASEIESYDELRRDLLGRYPQQAELRCLGELLLESCDGEVPLHGGRLVSAHTVENLHRRCQARMPAQCNPDLRRSK